MNIQTTSRLFSISIFITRCLCLLAATVTANSTALAASRYLGGTNPHHHLVSSFINSWGARGLWIPSRTDRVPIFKLLAATLGARFGAFVK